MYNIIHVNKFGSNFGCNLEEYKDFIKNNISNISMVRIDHTLFFDDLYNATHLNCFELKEVSSVLFNNSFIKHKAPMSTMEFSSEVADYLLANDYIDSIAVILYLHDIPMFINGVDYIDSFFSSSFKIGAPLVSNEDDFKILRQIEKKYADNLRNYIHIGFESFNFNRNNVPYRYGDIIDSEYVNKIDSNTLLREYYGKT